MKHILEVHYGSYVTTIIGTGADWWKERFYPSSPSNCRYSDTKTATEADAFAVYPLGFATCDVFSYKYIAHSLSRTCAVP